MPIWSVVPTMGSRSGLHQKFRNTRHRHAPCYNNGWLAESASNWTIVCSLCRTKARLQRGGKNHVSNEPTKNTSRRTKQKLTVTGTLFKQLDPPSHSYVLDEHIMLLVVRTVPWNQAVFETGCIPASLSLSLFPVGKHLWSTLLALP
jgi:hypothetical protein